MIICKKSSGYSVIVFFTLTLILILNHSTKSQDKDSKIKQPDELEVIHSRGNYWLHFSDAPNSLYHHITDQAFDFLERRSNEVAILKSRKDWQQRQKWIEETLTDIVGPFPEKTSLNAKITRTISKDNYKLEHIVFESQPGFFVTSSLFLPRGKKNENKFPVVIYCSGHSNDGYRTETYQHVILNLVNKGFVVFAFDPVGQGERIEYYDPETQKSIIGGPTKEHSYPGIQAFITGSSQTRYMVWDGIRAVDYLLTRSEIDPNRIGITGGSGGGTQSALIAAFDKRIYAAAPERYLTNFTRLLQSIGPTDAEQSIYNAVSRGIDHADLLIVRAPKPTLMITTTMDFFCIQGAKDTEDEVSRVYKIYGEDDNFSRVEDNAGHTSTKRNREAMYAFFQKHLNNPGNLWDEEIDILSSEEMKVTPTGQVSTSFYSETVYSLNRIEAEKLVNRLRIYRNDISAHQTNLLKSAKELSGYREPLMVNNPVLTGRIHRGSYTIDKYFVKGEGEYVVPYLLMIPEKPNNKALIYLHPSGKSTEAFVGGEIEWYVNKGFTVLVPDLLGIGETGPGHNWGSAIFNGINVNMWFGTVLIGRSIVGIRAGDLVKLTELLKKDSSLSEIYGLARQEMSPILLHAAALNANINHIVLVEPYLSYQSIVMNRFYNPEFIYGSVPGALKAYDLPDLAASLAPRKLTMINITNELGKIIDIEDMDDNLKFIRNTYQKKNAINQIKIISQQKTKNSQYLIEL